MTIGKYSEYENVIDFVEFKLHRIIDDFARRERDDIAAAFGAALDMYLEGKIDIYFVNGIPYMRDVAPGDDNA